MDSGIGSSKSSSVSPNKQSDQGAARTPPYPSAGMAFLRTIAVLTTLAATSVAAFAPLAPAGYRFSSLSKTGRILLPSATQYGRVQACTPKPLRIAPHRRVSMAWNSESYLIAPSIVNANLVRAIKEFAKNTDLHQSVAGSLIVEPHSRFVPGQPWTRG
jgi:hypothetical protein